MCLVSVMKSWRQTLKLYLILCLAILSIVMLVIWLKIGKNLNVNEGMLFARFVILSRREERPNYIIWRKSQVC